MLGLYFIDNQLNLSLVKLLMDSLIFYFCYCMNNSIYNQFDIFVGYVISFLLNY